MKHARFCPEDSPARQRRHQQGSIVVIVAAVLLVLVAMLFSVQMGYNYFEEQRLQKAADLAALSAVQVLIPGDGEASSTGQCSATRTPNTEAARQAGKTVAMDNSPAADGDITVTPLFWPGGAGAAGLPPNAVKVSILREPISLLPSFGHSGSPDAGASATRPEVFAIATMTEPTARFSVGSRLLSMNPDGLTGRILRGVGLSPDDFRVLDADGIASAMLTPAGLLDALGLPATVLAGVGTPEQLAELAKLNLGDLLDVYADILEKKQTADTDINIPLISEALLKIKATSLNVPIKLFGEGGVLADVNAANISTALNANIDIASMIASSIIVANGQNAINIQGLNILNLAKASLTVVSPPTIAWGGVCTTADNSQIRLDLDITSKLKVPLLGGILGSLLHTLVPIEIPVRVDVASSGVRLEKISTPGGDQPAATFSVWSAGTNACIGTVPNGKSCFSAAQDEIEYATLVSVLGLINVKARAKLALLESGADSTATLHEGEKKTIQQTRFPSDADIQRDTAQGLDTDINLIGIPLSFLTSLTDSLVETVVGTLSSAISQVLTPLLGLETGETDIELFEITGGGPYIVQ